MRADNGDRNGLRAFRERSLRAAPGNEPASGEDGKTYDEYIGHAALHDIGRAHWNRRMRKLIGIMEVLVTYDTLYIGGGNAHLLDEPLPEHVKAVSNEAGITGGVRLWDKRMDVVFEEHGAFG
jgi:polyphosphate glucokinase